MEHSHEHDVCFKWLIEMFRAWNADVGWETFGAIMTVFYKLYNNALQIHAAILLPPFLPRATI